jgi:hypothetical protein
VLFLIPLLIALAGVAALGSRLRIAVARLRFHRRALRAAGVVIGFDDRPRRRRGPLARRRPPHVPLVRFRAADDGGEIVTLAATCAALAALRVGDRVAVLYDPVEPARARLDRSGLRGALWRWLSRARSRPVRAGPSTPACRPPCPS